MDFGACAFTFAYNTSGGSKHMNKPILVVMAAGMGSRFGGPKQITPMDDRGHILIDYSLYDARRAGFERVIFIVKKEMENDFNDVIGRRLEKHFDMKLAYQRLDALPPGFSLPEGRVKPWGTAHAVLSAKDYIDANFAVINADDFYGADAFKSVYGFLLDGASARRHALVGYKVGNTLTENGHVARGVCRVEDGRLTEVTERTHIEARPGGAAYTEDGEHFTFIPADTIVSMNLWGFGREMIDEIDARFAPWLRENIAVNPFKCEYYVPYAVNAVLSEGVAEVSVMSTNDKWYGVTYPNDMPGVRQALAQMRAEGKYPERLLW
jgi:dTDP-glucose pyrophosphorylase